MNKVVLFIGSLIGAGGAERLLLEEEKFLRKKGIEVIILTFSLNKCALYDYKPEKIEVIKPENGHMSRIFALRRKILQIKPDLIISNTGHVYIYLATLFVPIPYIIHIHGTLFWFHNDTLKYALIHRGVFSQIRQSVAGHTEFIPVHPRFNIVKRIASEFLAIIDYFAVRKALKIIVLTDQLKWEVKKLYGQEALVARGCLTTEALSYKPKKDIRKNLGLHDEKIIFSVGRLDSRKRIDLLIKAFSEIVLKYEDIYLLIGGRGEDERRLKKLIEDLGIVERVKFLGFIPDSEISDYYAACDVFAFPSWTTSGITPYEALAANKKVVWTSEADEPILVDKHVFIADPNSKDFARAIEEALNTNVEGTVDLSNFTWDRYFEKVYIAAVDAIKR